MAIVVSTLDGADTTIEDAELDELRAQMRGDVGCRPLRQRDPDGDVDRGHGLQPMRRISASEGRIFPFLMRKSTM